MNLNSQINHRIITSSSSTVFDSYKPPTTNHFNHNSSLITLLNQIDSQQNITKHSNQKQSSITQLFGQKITIIYKHPTTISSHLNCPICYQIYSTPTRLYCGHTYCYKCLETIFDSDKVGGSRLTDDRTCPICRVVIDKNKVGKDLIAINILQELLVVCPREECPWEGMKKDLENHYRVDCVFKKSEKEKPLWQSVFPEHAPKENVQVDPVVKGSLLARIYAKNKQLYEKTTFEQLKLNLNGQTSSEQSNMSKRQQRLQKQKQKESQQMNRRIQSHMKQLQKFQQFCREKTPQQLQKEYFQLQIKKKQQKQQKRQKNIQQLQKILKEKQYQTLQENRRMQKEKQNYLQKQRLKNIQIQQNFNLKLNCLQRLMSVKNTKLNSDSQDEQQPESRTDRNQQNSGRKNDKNQSNNLFPPSNALGIFRKKPSFNEYMQKVKQKNHFQPYVEPQPSKEPPQIYDRGANSVKFKYNVGKATGPYNSRYTEPKVIIPSQNPNQQPSYLKKPNTYEATYEKHRLVRRPYVPPPNDGKIPEKIPHRYYTSIEQFSDPEYLASDKANRKGQFQHLQSTKRHIGVTNLKFKSY